MINISPKLVGIRDASHYLGLSPWTIRSWCYSGKIASHKVGSRLMVSMEELERVIHESERPRIIAGGSHAA